MVSSEVDTLVVQPELAELARIADWAEALAAEMRLPAATAFAIQLCLEEAVTNVVRHGLADRQPGRGDEILLSLQRRGDAVIVEIRDPGVAFDPLSLAAPAHATTVDEAVVGGQGVHLMRKFSQHMGYQRRDGMNCLTFRFDLPRPLA
jgi:anti-sigma regulatory factor (Ser/Thr protein kinase)